jgi:hypothetical protein
MFDIVLLPRRRFSRGGNPLARDLRRGTSADVRIVSARSDSAAGNRP